MEPVQWLPTFETGIPRIDTDHRALVNLVNEVVSAYNDGERDRMHQAARAFHSRVHAHFAAEEDLLRAGNFPRLESHSRFHILLEEHAESLVEWCKAATEPCSLEVCISAFRRFVVDEIITSDLDFKSHVQEAGITH